MATILWNRFKVRGDRLKAEGIGETCDRRSDAAHAQNAEGQFIELSLRNQRLSMMAPLAAIFGPLKVDSRSKRIAQQCDHVFRDGMCAGGGCVDDFDPSSSACSHIDVVHSDTSASDDLQTWKTIEQVIVDFGVGPDQEGFDSGRKLGEAWVIGCRGDHFRALFQPGSSGVSDGFSVDD